MKTVWTVQGYRSVKGRMHVVGVYRMYRGKGTEVQGKGTEVKKQMVDWMWTVANCRYVYINTNISNIYKRLGQFIEP